MPVNIKIGPVLCASGGAILSYYCLFPLYRSEFITINALLVFAFVPVAALCLFLVLASRPLLVSASPKTARLLRLMPLRITAFAAGLALGIGAGAKAVQKISFGIPEDTVRGISGVLLDDPRLISGGKAITTISLKMVMNGDNVRTSAQGEITVFFPELNAERLQEFGRGTEVFAEGSLRRSPNRFGGSSGNITFSAENLHITQTASSLERFRTGLRMDLTRRFARFSSGEASWPGLALALLLGIRDNLDSGLALLYRDAGCTHILALSGMHLAVLVAIISFLLKKPLGLRPATVSGALIIAAYIFIVGPLPSLDRSALMYWLGALAVLGMLKRDALLLLGMAFLIQLAITPQAGHSLAFILSYLALLGILVIGNWCNNILKGKVPFFLLSSFSASLGAFIATAGVTAWFFGILYPVGILSSIVLTPLTTVFMIGALIWLAVDIIAPSLSVFLGYPLHLLYWLMEKTTAAAATVPGIRANTWLVIILSLLVTVLLLLIDRRYRACKNRMEPFA